MELQAALTMAEQAYFWAAGQDGRVAIEAADREIYELGIHKTAIQAGDEAPDFHLPSATGKSISLRGQLADGPVILSFFRGAWCPFCRAELHALVKAADAVKANGATMIAISPQPKAQSEKLANEEGIDFPLLFDRDARVAGEYGLAFSLPKQLRLSAQNEGMVPGKDWLVPIPATYVIGQDGVVRFSFLDPNYRKRLDPSAIVDMLHQF